VKTFLVERFTAKRFLFRFLRSKNEKEEILRQALNDRKEYSPHRYIELDVENKEQ